MQTVSLSVLLLTEQPIELHPPDPSAGVQRWWTLLAYSACSVLIKNNYHFLWSPRKHNSTRNQPVDWDKAQKTVLWEMHAFFLATAIFTSKTDLLESALYFWNELQRHPAVLWWTCWPHLQPRSHCWVCVCLCSCPAESRKKDQQLNMWHPGFYLKQRMMFCTFGMLFLNKHTWNNTLVW